MLVTYGFFIMLKRNILFTLTLLYCTSPYANIPIESVGLSSSNNIAIPSSAPAIDVPNVEQPIPTNINWQLTQKSQELEKEIRVLRGKIEEQDNEITQLKNELSNRYTDLDQRLELMMQKVDPDYAPATEDNQQDTTPSSNTNNATELNKTTETQKTEEVSAPVAKTKENAINTPTSDKELEKAAYTIALEEYKQGGAKKAIAPMQNFIKNHPNSIYTSNAYFWLAEFNLALEPTNYTQAKKNFEIVLKQYPSSTKAASAAYRLYSIALNVDHNTTLANQYKAIILQKYPHSEEARFVKK